MSSNYERYIPELPTIMKSLGDFYMISRIDESGFITFTNKSFLKTSKWTPIRVIGKTWYQMFPESEEGQEQANLIWNSVSEGKRWIGLVEKVTRLGDPYFVNSIAIPIMNEFQSLTAVILFELDMTKEVVLREKLKKIAFIDFETGLMSRHHLESTINEFIEKKVDFTFVYLTIDQYHTVSSLQTHGSENVLVKSFSNRLKRFFKDNSIARIGANEFVVLTQFADWYIEGFLDFLKQQPIYIDNNALQLSVSGGIARYPENQKTYTSLMKAALTATKEVTDNGGGVITSLSAKSHNTLNRKAIIDRKLLTALDENNLQVVYQPQMDLTTGKVLLFEAFVRWKDDELGWIMPDEFIPIAEENGLIHQIGAFVLKEAAKQATKWNSTGHSVKVAINSSIREFNNPRLKDEIKAILNAESCSPSLIQFEITEKFAFQAEEELSIYRQMQELQGEGIEFVLDNFGTGYASFRYMQYLPITKIKIDSLFIHSMISQPKTKKLVEGMIQFGKSMGLYVVAEGVETKEQFDLLKEMKVDAIQGYYIGVPTASEKITLS